MTAWTTIAELGTAAGTLVLAVATFASVRSANRAARAAELAVMESLRPLVLASRLEDPPEKVGFADDHWVKVLRDPADPLFVEVTTVIQGRHTFRRIGSLAAG